MNKNSIKNFSSSSSLSWSDDKKNAEIGKIIKQTLSIFPLEESVDITFTLDSPNVAFKENKSQQWNETTDFFGKINVNIYSVTKTPCDFKLSAYCSDSPEISAKPLLLEFLPKEVNNIKLVVNKDNAQANGIDIDELTATVQDDEGHPIKGVMVDFTADNGARVSPSSGQTDEKGEIAITVTSESGGEVKVWAIVSQYSKMTTTLVQFKEDYGIELIPKKDNAKANGIDTDELTAAVKDYGGHPIKGVTVDFTADNGARVSPSSGQTDEKGEIAITVTSESGGEVRVQATVAQNGKMADATVQFNQFNQFVIEITNYPETIFGPSIVPPIGTAQLQFYQIEGCLRAHSESKDASVNHKKIKIKAGNYIIINSELNSKIITDDTGRFNLKITSNYNRSTNNYDSINSSITFIAEGAKEITKNIVVYPGARYDMS
ncbi:Ig-like domain-containing protein [Xenorhabdus bovienii]|uniref:Ig-like domain-containing protein n=1 Tax=Xenorhabdus bovienii TaxID=40576 RepID=UPI0023B2C062|nr:Ig-like domain-containing protein [Xenorhabdus bovienii]MDE9505843.1 Ig-like domain-containing protein [Xenorhabdus bovienii]